MNKSNADLYDPQYVSSMFDRMSKTYGFANLVTSFGFTAIWRKQCVKDLALGIDNSSIVGYDFMSGMGELWPEIQKRILCKKIVAVDISAEMNRKAAEHLHRLKHKNIILKQDNVLQNNIPSNSADFIVSSFGIKTFNQAQLGLLAEEVGRILKSGGSFAFIEISKPEKLMLQWLFMFYLKIIIPLIGKVFLGNSEDYKMLGKYCARFENSRHFYDCLKENNLNTNYKQYFFGCTTRV